MSSPANTEVDALLARLQQALDTEDVDAAVDLFHEDGYWRDLAAFTWNITTLEGREQIRRMLHAQLDQIGPGGWQIPPGVAARASGDVVESIISFSTLAGQGRGYVRIRDGRIWTLLTSLESLAGYEEATGALRPTHAARNDAVPGRADEFGANREPYVLIVGGGQGGVMLAARLRQLDVPTLVVERRERPGDSWRSRYKTLALHNPIWENQFPYLDFPEDWPVFLSKDQYGEWLDSYTQLMRLDYWGSSPATSAVYDEQAATWSVTVQHDGSEIVLHPAHLVLATGAFGDKPQLPDLPGRELFEGSQLHSSQFVDAADFAGKRVAIVGSGVSAHDVAAALVDADADVTMIQRSPTHVVRTESLLKYQLAPLYSAEAVAHGINAETADLLAASLPFKVFFDVQKMAVDQVREADAKFYEALTEAGFLLDFGPHDSGLFGKAMTGAFNYYVDIGASQLIIDGTITLESGAGIRELTRDGLVLDDGRELRADVIVYATGFTSMMDTTAELISADVADKVGKIWGLGSGARRDPGPWEGELRNMWKPTQQDGLWFHGSLVSQARFYSRILALQLKARMEGLPTPVYGLQERHHRR